MPTIIAAINKRNQPHIDPTCVPTGIDGKDLWPCILGKEEGTHDRIYLSECAWQAARGIRTDKYKFIRNYDSGPYKRPARELYDLQADPEEKENLALTCHELASQLEQELDAWVQEVLQGKDDPMMRQLQEEGLPFRKRIEKILANVNLTWEEWQQNPQRSRIDSLIHS